MKLISVVSIALCLATPAVAKDNPLRGSHHALVWQNRMADREHLTRLRDKQQLKKFRKKGLLVHLPKSKKLRVDHRLPADYRYVRPQTKMFLLDLSRHFYGEFHHPLQVNSAVRTEAYQERLTKRNGNAAKGKSKMTRSSHLTGATVDIAKKGLTTVEIKWLRKLLSAYDRSNMIEATEERRQPCFHIMVIHWRKK